MNEEMNDVELDVVDEAEETSVEDEDTSSDSEESLEAEDNSQEDIDWKARALKAEQAIIQSKERAKEVKKNINNNLPTKAENPGDEVTKRIANLEMAERKRQFGYEHGLSPAETDRVFQVNNNPSADTLKDPFIKAGLEAIRSQERADRNVPSSSAKSASLDRRKMSEMSAEDKQAQFQKYMKSKGIGA